MERSGWSFSISSFCPSITTPMNPAMPWDAELPEKMVSWIYAWSAPRKSCDCFTLCLRHFSESIKVFPGCIATGLRRWRFIWSRRWPSMWMENPWENKRTSPFPVCPEDCGYRFKTDGKKIDIKDCFLRFLERV